MATAASTDPTEDEATEATRREICQMINRLVFAVIEARHYEDSLGKYRLWAVLISLIQRYDEFVEITVEQEFLHPNIQIIQSPHGLVVYTSIREKKVVNLNLIVPTACTVGLELLQFAYTTIVHAFGDDCGVNLEPLKTHFTWEESPRLKTRPRRFLMNRSEIANLVYDPVTRKVEHMGLSLHVDEVVNDPGAVSKHTPLTRLSVYKDPPGKTYWVKMPRCGTLLILRNPTVTLRSIRPDSP